AMKNSGVGTNSTHARANSAAVTASTIGYRHGMGAAHVRHRPRSSANESRGMLSYHVIGAPQPGHAERGAHRLRRSGSRAMTTLRKLPNTSPNAMTATSPMSELMFRGYVPRDDGMQLPQNRELLAHLCRVPGGTIREDESNTRLGGIRLLAGRAMELGQRLVDTLETDECLSEVRARHDVGGLHFDGPTQVWLRLGESLLLIQREPEVVERAQLHRRLVDDVTKGGLRFTWTAKLE